MEKVILHGCTGRMGHIITDIVAGDPALEIVAGVDAYGEAYAGYPVYRSLAECPEADVIIDFSTAAAMDELLRYCADKQIPCVLCTTGLSEAQTALLKETSAKTAILKSANMSLGINLLETVLKEVAPRLAQAGFDIEVVEKHHNQKMDAPSGTALALAEAVNEAMAGAYEYV